MNWLKLPSIKTARSNHASFNLGNKLVVVGGQGTSGWFKSSEVYDLIDGKWSNGPNLPYSLTYPRAATNQTQTISIIIGRKSEEVGKVQILIFDNLNTFREIASTDLSYQDYYCYYSIVSTD